MLIESQTDAQTLVCHSDLKHRIKCMGIKAPILQSIFKQIWNSDIKSMVTTDQISLAMECYESQYIEYKHIGCYILQKINKKLDESFLINQAIKILTNYCNCWATCDSFSNKVIRHMIDKDKTNKYALTVKTWKDSKSIWMQRCSCVSFVCLARHGNYNEIIIEICTQCIQNNERFVQLGTGWLLRELSLADLNLVISFIKKNYAHFSREGLRYAIEKMDAENKQKMLKYDANKMNKSRKRKAILANPDVNSVANIKKRKLN